ncbi:recombinase family protein [Kineosporia rhizophila]|uniref:hypothetical protein n=1 Tax=Kineosporia rhizophila TaxID=84633 RepID=UPI0038CC15B0
MDALTAAGCWRIFAEKRSGRDTARPQLTACLDFMATATLSSSRERSRAGERLAL